MHKESFEIMKSFVERYLDKNDNLEILDVGSYDVNGNYKILFQNPGWYYCGLDIAEGPNVDVVSRSAYDFGLNKQFDIVVSGNCLEHVESPWKWVKEIEKVTKTGSIVCIITPFSLLEHKHPVDCWRVLPDGYKYLFEQESNFTVLESKFNKPAAQLKYKYFNSRPKLKWILKLLPSKIKKIFEYDDAVIDTYVIAKKN